MQADGKPSFYGQDAKSAEKVQAPAAAVALPAPGR
jgi:hypothetical protein